MKYKLIIFLEKWRTIILVGGVRDARRWRRCASALLVGKLFMTSKSVTLNHGEPRPVSSAVPGLLTKLSFYQSVIMTLSSPSHQDAHTGRTGRSDGSCRVILTVTVTVNLLCSKEFWAMVLVQLYVSVSCL